MTEDLKALIKQKGIEYFLCSFVEMSGIPKAKLVPASALDDMVSEGAGFAGFCGHGGTQTSCVLSLRACLRGWRRRSLAAHDRSNHRQPDQMPALRAVNTTTKD